MSLLDLDKFLGLIQDDNSATATSNLAENYDQNPKDHIERTRLQNQTGIPAVLMDDPIVKSDAKKQAYAKSLPKMKDFPATSSFAADPNNAPMIVDDVPALTSFEQRIKNIKSLWSDVLAPTPARAYSQFVKGVGGLDLWLGETLGIDWYLKQGKALQEESRITSEQIEKEHPTGDPSSWKGGLSSGLTSTYLQAPFMGAGFLAGSARAATGIVLSSMGATTYGQTYSERRSAGVGKASSSLSALWDGGIEVGTELLPTGTLLKMMKPVAKQALGKLLFNGSVYYGEEIVGESLATFFQDANAKIAGDPNMNTKQRVNALSDYLSSGEAYDNWMATLKATTTQVVIVGGAGIGINRLQNRTAVDRAKQQTAAIDELIKAADASNLKEGSPEAFIDFAQKAGDQHGTSAIYLQADRAIEEGLKQGVTEEQIPAWLGQYGVTPEDLTTAIHTGGHIQLDFGKWINGYTNDPALQALQKDFMISPEVLPENRVEEAAQIEQAHLERLTDLYNKDQENRINQDDVALWQEGVLSTPAGQKGLITSDSVALLAKRANLISQETGIPAIDILNRYLSPMNLRVEKYKDFQARQDGGEGMLNEDDSNAPVVNPPSNEVPSYFTEEFKTRIGNIDLYGGTIEQALNAIANRASLSEAGRRFGVEETQSDGTVETVSKSFESTFPEYLSNKKETLNVIDKYLSGKKLTENQQRKLTYWLEGYAELDLKPEIESFKDDPRFKDIMSGKYKPGEATVGEDGMLRDENGNVLFQTAPPIDTPEFKTWFGDSKVVDEDGKPLVVYHGTDKEFSEFKNMGGKVHILFSSFDVPRRGFFFSPDKDIARNIGSRVMPVYLSIKNPADLRTVGGEAETRLINEKGFNERWLTSKQTWELFDEEDGEAFVTALKDLGYDGAIIDEPAVEGERPAGYTYVAFSPTQIKSVNNKGTFDPNNPNIYYQSEENPLENIAEEVSIDTSKLSKEALNRMNIYLKSKGYDVRGGQDIKELLDERMLKDGVLWHPDWIAAYEKATKGVKSRKAKVEEKRKYTNINRKRLRELGYTYDLKEAGYITPQGKLIDLSGKREGGQRGERAYDHREAGGTIGMQEFMAEGNIRMDFNSGSLDIVSIPTARQLSVIQGIINAHNGEIVVDLWDGLGEQKGDYYNEPGRIFSKEYPKGTRAFKIINDIKKFYAGEAPIDSLFQKQNSDPLGVLAISNSQNMVSLFEKADKSTFLHETAHIFLNDLKFVAETLGVQTAEWNKTKEWLGIGEDGIITVEAHEKFADHFEAYLKNGQAPTPELKSAFRTFKRWLTAIYEGVRSRRAGQLQITVSPEISDLFDHLLATEQEIKAAREQAALIALMDDAMLKEMNATPEQIGEYRKLNLQSEDSAKEKRDTHRLNDREARLKDWKTQAESESLREPVYRFIYAMSKIGGIDRQSVVDQFGTDNIPDLPQLWRKDGLDINVAVAENGKAFDYENAASFVENLKTMLPRKVWVAQRVAALEAIYDNSQDTQEAIRTSALRKMMEIESEWLAKKAVSQYASRAAMKIWAEGVIDGKTMRQIRNVNPLLSQSRSHRQNAILAVREGRWEDALKYNEQARLTEELITASYRAAKAWTKKEAHWKRIAKWTNDNKSVKVGTRFRDQINRVLQQYSIARKEFDPAAPDIHSFVSSLSENELESASVALADWIGVQTGDYKALTWERLKDLDDALSYLYGHGRQEVEGLKTSKGIKVSEYAGQIIEEQAGLKAKPDLVRDDKKLWVIPTGKILKGVQKNYRKFFANTNILRFMAQRMDGYTNVGSKGKMGPAEQVVQDITSGMARSNDMWTEISARIEPQIKVLTKDNGMKFDDLRLPEEMKRSGDAWNKSRVVAACLNMGTATNLQRLTDGYGLGEEDLHALAGKLTAEEWNSIQSIWDTISSLWPQIAGTHERLNFFKPKKVEAHRLKINTADGQVVHLEGGYYPIAYDKSKDQKVAEWMEKDDILASHEAILQRPTPKAGFTKGRVDRVFRPLNLSLSVLSTHFNDTIRYIALAEAVRDADRIFGNKDLSKQNIETFGREMQDMIRPALKNVLRPDIHDLGMFERGRIAMSIYYMGYNAWTAIQNTTGIFPAIRQAGVGNYMNGIMHVISNPLSAYRAMLEASGYMRLRASNQERDMKTQLRNFKVDGIEINGKRYTYDDAKGLGFAGIRFIDALVGLPAWWGTYNDQMNQHGNMQKATEAADAVINKALGSGLAIDSTGFGRHAFFRLLAPFMSFASTQQEVLATEREAWRQGELSTSEFLYGQLMTWVLPAMLSTFLQGALMYGIAGALGGGDNDKRKKTARDYATDIMAYRLMGIPFVRDVYNAIVQGVENRAPVTSARMPVTEAYAMMQNAAYRVGNWDGSEKKTKALMWTAAELVSLSSGVPATRVYDRWMKGQKDIENGTGWWGNHFIPQEKKK